MGARSHSPLTAEGIRRLGFEWPKFASIERQCVVENGEINLSETLRELQSSRDFYGGQLDAAFSFKWQTGADYADFTDRRDDYATLFQELQLAVAYVKEILEAVES